ncbi:MAG: hypothetical protein ABSE43_17140 [Steroidobacteraceae bacterium]|jgi:hypothetical protein
MSDSRKQTRQSERDRFRAEHRREALLIEALQGDKSEIPAVDRKDFLQEGKKRLALTRILRSK